MRKIFLLLFTCLLMVEAGLSALADSPLKPDVGGVTMEVPEDNKIEAGTALSISFPVAMVGAEKIDLPGEPCPVRFEPAVNGDWLWKSQTDGEFTIKTPITPGLTCTIKLASGLHDLTGTAVVPANWGAELHTDPFEAKSDWEPTDQLKAFPGVVAKFTYPVRLTDAATRIYFQDRDSGARQGAELALRDEDRDDEPEAAVLRATPRDPLPAGRTWDLVIEDVREQNSGQPPPYLKRVPLGVTAPMTLLWLGAFNQPLEPPVIRARFDDFLDPASVSRESVIVEPAVPKLTVRVDDEDLVLEGDFDRAKHYQVTVNTTVHGRRGYGLAAPGHWGATFRPKPSALYFPGRRISQRARLGLRFSFLQVHTGALRWRLAAVPMEKLPSVDKRVREFESSKVSPITHEPEDVPQPTELLIDALGLSTKAEGTFPASVGEAEDARELRWPSPGETKAGVLAGAYLLEIDGPRWDGKGTVGQRSLVIFSESVITEKRTPDAVIARVARMADGQPRVGVPVRALSASNFELARAITDADGLARFTYAELHPPKGQRGGEVGKLLVADTPEGSCISSLDADSLDDVTLPEEPPAATAAPNLRLVILTDRSLYRPGQTVRIKGLVRTADTRVIGKDSGKLRIPAGQTVAWRVTGEVRSETIAEGKSTVDAEGGWEAQWAISPDAKLGDYRVSCTLGSADQTQGDTGSEDSESQDGSGASAVYLHVQDYKVPLFEVAAEGLPSGGQGAPALCKVRASYFSGQPVAGSRVSWRVRWVLRDYLDPQSSGDNTADSTGRNDLPAFMLDDTYSEHAPPPSNDDSNPPETKGEARLDARGEGTLRAELPKNLHGARYEAHWEIAVTSADGQSVAAGHAPTGIVMCQPVLLGVAGEISPGKDGAPTQQGVRLRAAAFDAQDRPTRTRDARVELFRVSTKTVRENVAPFVVRYRNTPIFTSIKSVSFGEAAPGALPVDVPVDQPGRYVAVATAPGLRQVSAEIVVDGPGEDEVPVQTQTSLEIRPEKKEYSPGETAAFLTRAPVTGLAWVSVETDRILDTLLIPLVGNTSRVEFPVKAEYAPNAEVAIYLLRPGNDDRLPAERFGHVQLRVRRPDRVLDVHPTLEASRVRPGEEVRGQVRIDSANRPVSEADVTVWAVDDALLALGEWHAPDMAAAFYPDRVHRVKTYAALRDYVLDISRQSLFEKGFVIGGGGEEFGGKFVRKDFQPLAYWKTGLKTDAGGNVSFAFAAPDNLTRYRVIAVAQTRAGQFGEGESSVEIAKPLIVEPSLPRFLRAGDEVELRAVARQSVHDNESLAATCVTDAGLTLDPAAPAVAPVAVSRDAPAVFRFRAKVPDGPASAKITIRAGAANPDPEMADAVEVTLPIFPPTILRREATTGTVPAGGDVSSLLPEDARRPGAVGHYDAAVSTSSDLPRLRALPEVLEYPHGCFEQITSRVLAYCGARDLLAGLPADMGQKDKYRHEVERGLQLCSRSILEDGRLPYWPGQKTGNPFVTVQAAWALRQTTGAGLDVDATLAGKLDGAVKKIATDATVPAMVRAYALMVEATPAAKAAVDAGTSEDSTDSEPGGIDEDAARAVYLHRETLGDEGRALLAVALHRAKIMPEEKHHLLREILPLANGSRSAPERAFDPYTFGSTRRVEAVAIWAFAEVRPPEWKPSDAAAARVRLGKVLDQASLNSTQENLWTLFAFHAIRKLESAPKLRLARVQPIPQRISPNGTAAEWTGLAIGGSGLPFRVPVEIAPSANAALSYVLSAEYRVGRAEEDTRRDRGGMRVERVVHNLTDPKRTGRPGETPLHINDRLLITYRLQTPKPRAYVALEDELPAGLETVNPELPLFAPFYDLPPTPAGQREASLSSSELHDHATLLYFDRLEPGVSVYSVLARASAAGSFRWPATQAGPMYDPAVGGLAPSEQLVVTGD